MAAASSSASASSYSLRVDPKGVTKGLPDPKHSLTRLSRVSDVWTGCWYGPEQVIREHGKVVKRRHCLLTLFPPHAPDVVVRNGIAFGYLYDFGNRCAHCKKEGCCTLRLRKSYFDGVAWERKCDGGRKYFDVKKRSIFEGMTRSPLPHLLTLTFVLLQFRFLGDDIDKLTSSKPRQAYKLRQRLMQQAAKWNKVFSPEFSGHLEFDEFCGVKGTGLFNKKKKGAPLSMAERWKVRRELCLKQWWGLHLVHVETGKCVLGLCQRRNTGTLSSFVLNHLNLDERTKLATDTWKASVTAGYAAIPDSRIQHVTVNHKKEFVNDDGESINHVERANSSVRRQILNPARGTTHLQCAARLQFFQCIVNQGVGKGAWRDLSQRYVLFGLGCQQVWEHEDMIDNPVEVLSLDKAQGIYDSMPKFNELRHDDVISGFTCAAIRSMAGRCNRSTTTWDKAYHLAYRPDVRGRVRSKKAVIWKNVDESGLFYAGILSQSKDTEHYIVELQFLDVDAAVPLHEDNIQYDCSNAGCQTHRDKEGNEKFICKHALALLISVSCEDPGSGMSLPDFIKHKNRMIGCRRSSQAVKNPNGHDGEWTVERVLCVKNGKALVKWGRYVLAGREHKTKFGSQLEWIDAKQVQYQVDLMQQQIDVCKYIGLPRASSF